MAWKWYDSKIVKIEQIANHVRSFYLQADEPFTFKPGQFITLDLPISEKRLKRWRSYSIASCPDESLIELCIVKLEGGKGTSYLFEGADVGTSIKFKGPAGAFIAPENPQEDLVFICTGTGIAPFRPMIYDLLERQKTEKSIHLVFGTRSKQGLLYKKEWDKLSEKYPNFRYSYSLSREACSEGYEGYVHQIYLEQDTCSIKNTKYYLCGWSNMVDEAVDNLTKIMNVPKERILYELYG